CRVCPCCVIAASSSSSEFSFWVPTAHTISLEGSSTLFFLLPKPRARDGVPSAPTRVPKLLERSLAIQFVKHLSGLAALRMRSVKWMIDESLASQFVVQDDSL